MNLKYAFRAQNKLQALMDEAGEILQNRGNTLKVTTTHLRSKVMPAAQDAVTEDTWLKKPPPVSTPSTSTRWPLS